MGEGATEDKTTLAQKDIRFARTVQRLQRVIVSELEKIGIIHLYTLGYRGDDLLNFNLSLNNPSKIAEMQELDSWKTRFEVAKNANEVLLRWVAENLRLSEDEFIRMQREMFHDRRFNATVANRLRAGGGGLGDLGGDQNLGGGLGDLGTKPLMPQEHHHQQQIHRPQRMMFYWQNHQVNVMTDQQLVVLIKDTSTHTRKVV